MRLMNDFRLIRNKNDDKFLFKFSTTFDVSKSIDETF